MLRRCSCSLILVGFFGWAVIGLQDTHAGAAPQQTSFPVISTFDADSEGWTTSIDAEGNPTPTWVATGGNPGGHIFARDGLDSVKWYWYAPQKFLGDVSSAYGSALTFDLRQSSEVNPTNDADVILVGAGMTLVFDTPYNPSRAWTAYRVPLVASGGWKKDSLQGPAPTQGEMLAVLRSLTDLRIRGDYIFGQSVCNLDNVVFGVDALLNEPFSPFTLFLPIVTR